MTHKFLFITDTHGITPKKIPHLKEEIKDCEAIFHSGDFTNFEKDIKIILREWDRLKKPTFIINGNHETELSKILKELRLNNIRNINNKAEVFGDFIIAGLGGGGFTIDSPNTKILRKEYKKIASKNKDKKSILITHAPPFGTQLDFLDIFTGNIEIRQFIEDFQPIICSCGHLHENENKQDTIDKTIIINPGWQGAIVTIDKKVDVKFSEENIDF